MTDQALDDLARRLLLDAARQEYAALVAEAPEHSFSPAFERKMKKLIRRTDHPVRHRLAQAVACLLLAALLSGCSLLAFSPTARNALAGWVREVFSTWSIYRHSGEAQPALEDAVYRPAWVPPAYEEVLAPETGNFVRILYETPEGSLLRFSYLKGIASTALQVEWEGAVVRPVLVGTLPGELYQNPEDGPNILVWTDQERDAVFWITAPLEERELVKIATSVACSPMPKRYRISWLPVQYGGFFVASEHSSQGKGETVYEGNDALTITFGYSNDRENDPPYPEKQSPGEPVQVGEAPATLYRAQEAEEQQLLVWDNDDASVVLWVRAALPVELLLQIGESVIPDLNDLTGTMEISTFEPGAEPLLEEVKAALTDPFLAQVEAYARRDAAANYYMQPDYNQMVRDYQAQHLSPQREEAMARVSPQVERLQEAGTPGEHVLSLFGPFYSASIFVSYHATTAHICDEYGEMIASYHSGNREWTVVPTKAEMQFSYEVNQVYLAAYRAARAELTAD